MINQLIQLFETKAPEIGQAIGAPKNPSDKALFIGLLVGFLILAAICLFVYYKYSLPNMKKFKQKQLDEYIRQNPRRQNITYEKTGMYLPSWQRAKYNSTLFLAILFFAGALALLIALASS